MRSILLAVALLFMPSIAAAADVAGSWKVDGSIGEFPVDLVCTFKQDEARLTGVCAGRDIGELPFTGQTDGATVTWSYDVNFQGQQFSIVYSGTTDSATTMKGSIAVMGNPSGSFTAKKQ
jgi:hypothetical protein